MCVYSLDYQMRYVRPFNGNYLSLHSIATIWNISKMLGDSMLPGTVKKQSFLRVASTLRELS